MGVAQRRRDTHLYFDLLQFWITILRSHQAPRNLHRAPVSEIQIKRDKKNRLPPHVSVRRELAHKSLVGRIVRARNKISNVLAPRQFIVRGVNLPADQFFFH